MWGTESVREDYYWLLRGKQISFAGNIPIIREVIPIHYFWKPKCKRYK